MGSLELFEMIKNTFKHIYTYFSLSSKLQNDIIMKVSIYVGDGHQNSFDKENFTLIGVLLKRRS